MHGRAVPKSPHHIFSYPPPKKFFYKDKIFFLSRVLEIFSAGERYSSTGRNPTDRIIFPEYGRPSCVAVPPKPEGLTAPTPHRVGFRIPFSVRPSQGWGRCWLDTTEGVYFVSDRKTLNRHKRRRLWISRSTHL